MLVRLVYASLAAGEIDHAMIASILEQSQTYNLEHGITGVLCTYPQGNLFLQVLEGSRAEVNQLYATIVRDPRHRDVTLLDYAEIDERRFAGWRMGSVDLGKVNLSNILRYSEKPVLDPFTMTGRAALALLGELTASAAIVSHE